MNNSKVLAFRLSQDTKSLTENASAQKPQHFSKSEAAVACSYIPSGLRQREDNLYIRCPNPF